MGIEASDSDYSLPTVSEVMTVASGIGAGIGANVLLQRAATAGIALADSVILPVGAAAVAGLAAAGLAGYAAGSALNQIPGVHDAAVDAVGAIFDAAHDFMQPPPARLGDVGFPSFNQIANLPSYNPGEGTYTSGTDIGVIGISNGSWNIFDLHK